MRGASWRSCLLAAALGFAASGALAASDSDPATALRSDYERLSGPLQKNPFERPLALYSLETSEGLQGDIYAVVAYPFSTVSTGLKNPGNWCEVMILHINTKYCHAVKEPTGTVLRVYIGKKTPQTLADAARVDFQYQQTAAAPGYFAITLKAKDGPLGTSNYLIQLEAVEISKTKSFLHLTYSYGVGFAGRVAMQAYLATAGAGKVGFTLVDQGDNGGEPDFVAGVRGVVERNTMRYYLAIDSFLASQSESPSAQLEKRLQAWFTAVERYPRQLHEVTRPAYLEMKRAEVIRQQSAP
jgi:hypothetical protein